ncbi:M48 family metallopeptidase [Parasphingorhabdus cellanae]|uniref:M48 family metallopeptidase n=1 Tax=Parasphingorhabdus cellanae TaxID=2806553 RepID=A0ABX7T1B1_9SPHN|nr:SprT family zinc-dependent metalloprotease [Parasphingorhabdus cellanae]QTD54753.1 M48 family metallopeptidase [Parasphingorhabdus cellanae]
MNRSSPRSVSTDQDELEIELAGRFYPLRIRKLRQSRSIAVSADIVKGEVRLTMPRYASTAQALRFAQSKSNWLAGRFADAPPPVPIINGTELAFTGESHFVRWSSNFSRKPLKIDDEIRVGGPEERIEGRVIDWMKDQARSIYADDLSYYCDKAATELPALSIGDARRRWGSCSGRKAIRLSWRLVMAPPMVRRSVVAHEVAHLRHMNHSPAFYTLLDTIFEGERRAADRWLKQHGSALHLIGAPTHNI